MRKLIMVLLALLLIAPTGFTTASPSGGAYSHLSPGNTADLSEKVPINFVFVGYEPEDIDVQSFLSGLPQAYKPVVRSRLWYGVTEHLGINYTYDYKSFFTDSDYETRFFDMLSSNAKPADLTLFQQQYNDQLKNVRDLTDNHFIDAPTVEKWLTANPPSGVDTVQNTVFFINWWGNGTSPREGFKNHVYTKMGEPDPDTGYDFGKERASRKIIAWGGTTPDDEETGLGSLHRIWFHDLSAGPESWTDNWNVDNPDLTGDGIEEYRMPPVWEYFSPGGYRVASELTSDLAKIARYVAIDLLFTTSPLYPPSITPNQLPESINLDFNTYQQSKKLADGASYQKPPLAEQELSEVYRISFNSDTHNHAFAGEAEVNYKQWLRGAPSYPDRPEYPSDANLYIYHALNRDSFADGGADYEGMFFNYVTDDALAPGYLGFADDNWYDGTQSFTFNFLSPGVKAAGYGLTTTQIHEFGHHFGMSHPHDGYDFESGRDYGPEDDLYFVSAGDEVNSMMSYIDLNWDYSQFDRDNANRFQAAAYITNANAIARDILNSQNGDSAEVDLQAADANIGKAKAAMAAHNYPATFDFAKQAYDNVLAGAAKAGITIDIKSPNGWYVVPATRGKKAPNKNPHAYQDKIGPGIKRSAP